MKCSRIAVCLSVAVAFAAMPVGAADVAVTVRSDNVVNKIDNKIYGHFFEHIYHSANNGIWGELVWNRSFEQNRENNMGPMGWSRSGGVLAYAGDEPQSRVNGAYEYRDFDFTVEARKLSGDGLRLFFRGNAVLTLGARGNTVHLVEPAAGGGRGAATQPAPTFGEPVAGSLNANQWYKIRVRMEGQKLEAWLDDKQILAGDMPAPGRGGAAAPPGINPQGWMGVGVVNAKAEFRNFLIKGLDGQVFWNEPFYSNVPNAIPQAERWGVTGGTAQIIATAGAALNDERCLQLTGTATTALSQPGFYVKANDPLEGSLWLKGRSGEVTVQLVEDGTDVVLSELSLNVSSAEWKECPLQMPISKTAEATLKISFKGDHQVMIDQVSLMAKSSKDNGGFRVDLYEAFKGLQPTVMRWPGGCYAETYVWKRGIGAQKDRKKGQQVWWEEFDPNALGTDEYIQLSRKLNSEPLLVIQTGMHQVKPGGSRQDNDPIDTPEEWAPYVKEACEWIEYCNGPATSTWGKVRAANGHPEPYNVKLWEIDNELWRSRVTSPEVYSQAVRIFSDAMKKQDPSITIIAHGGNGTDRNYNIPVVNNAAETFSVFSIHHYTNAAQYVTGVGAQDALYTDVENLIKGSKNPNIKIYVSEWNAQTTDWRTGLYAGGILNTFEKHGANITMAGPALMGRHVSAHGWDNAFINFDNKGWFAGPNYVVMKLWRESFAPNRLGTDGGNANLNVIATKTDDGGKLILKAVNFSETEPQVVTATIDGAFRASGASMQLVNPGSLQSRNSMAAREVIKPVEGAATRSMEGNQVRFTLPPNSVGVVTLRK